MTPDSTLGFDVVEFAEDDLGVSLHPYQRWLYIHALEVLPSGLFRFRTVVVLIARQNGKTTWWKILVLYCMYVLGMRLVLSTAQDLDTAEGTWQEVVDWVLQKDEDEEEYVYPDLAAMVARVVQVNGKKSLNLKSGEEYKAKASSRRAGRGKSAELVGMDELREQQTWDSWAAITHTIMARARALIVALSNAGDVTSVVLRHLRKLAHLALGDPDGVNASDDPALLLSGPVQVDAGDESIGLFEWSARPGADIRDWGALAWANPSLGYPNGVTERNIRSAWVEPEWVFRTEVMCQWTDGTIEGPFPAGSWDAGVDDGSRRGEGEPVSLCVDVAWDRSVSHVGLAARRADGLVHVEVIASRAGTDWVVPWFASDDRSAAVRSARVVVQAASAPVASLVDGLVEAGVQVVEWKGPDLAAATGAFYDLVREGRVRHRRQSVLDVAAATAVTRPMGDAFVWDRKHSPTDVAPLVAVTGAAWLAASQPADYDLLASVI